MQNLWGTLKSTSIFIAFAVICTQPIHASPTMSGIELRHSDDLWITVGGGLKLQVASRDSDFDNSNQYTTASFRTYIAGQLHQYLKFYVNTEKYEGDSMMTIDAILAVELDPAVNLWVGRTLVPSDRPGMNGPYTGTVSYTHLTLPTIYSV